MLIIPDWAWFSMNALAWFLFYRLVVWQNRGGKQDKIEREAYPTSRPTPNPSARPVPTGAERIVALGDRRFELLEVLYGGNVVKTAVREILREGGYGPQAAYAGEIQRIASAMVANPRGFQFP